MSCCTREQEGGRNKQGNRHRVADENEKGMAQWRWSRGMKQRCRDAGRKAAEGAVSVGSENLHGLSRPLAWRVRPPMEVFAY
jgi:hypothetical protein